MANALNWPASLKRPVAGSESGEIDLGLDTFTAESGLSRQYRLHSLLPTDHDMTLWLSPIEANRLVAFAQEAAGQSFDITLPVPGDIDTPFQTVSARFVSNIRYDPRASAGSKLYSFRLRIARVTPDDRDWGYFDALGDQFDPYWQALENLVNNYPA